MNYGHFRFLPFLILWLPTTGVLARDTTGDWVSLFNGVDLKGWTVRGGGATFHVADGTIVGVNGPAHNTFLCSVREYSDFELEFEVRVADALNSGVQIRSRSRLETIGGKKEVVVYGPQVEIAASPSYAGLLYGERYGKFLTPPETVKLHSLFRNGEWNRYRVIAEGARIRVWLNERLITDITDESLYREHPSGFIGLQVHQTKTPAGELVVAWRKLRVRVLSHPRTE